MENGTKKYREKYGIGLSKLSEMTGISKQLIQWHEKHPESRYTYRKAVKIDQATKGEVRWIDLV